MEEQSCLIAVNIQKQQQQQQQQNYLDSYFQTLENSLCKTMIPKRKGKMKYP